MVVPVLSEFGLCTGGGVLATGTVSFSLCLGEGVAVDKKSGCLLEELGGVGTKTGMGVRVVGGGDVGTCLLGGRDGGGVSGRSLKNQWQFSMKVSAILRWIAVSVTSPLCACV